ncbi:MAG: hypothetical protein KAT15_08830, partial [Bacteroidales bacterium]|nr:hypothetical protein [Bacteroidales bacterium]
LEAYELIDQAEVRLYDLEIKNIDSQAAKELFNKGLGAFDIEMYEDARDYFKQVIDKTDELEAAAILERATGYNFQESAITFLGENWFMVSILLISLSAITIVSFRLMQRNRKLGRIKTLEKEKRLIEKLIMKIQKDYYELGKTPKSEYLQILRNHQKRLGILTKDISTLRSKH